MLYSLEAKSPAPQRRGRRPIEKLGQILEHVPAGLRRSHMREYCAKLTWPDPCMTGNAQLTEMLCDNVCTRAENDIEQECEESDNQGYAKDRHACAVAEQEQKTCGDQG